MGVGVGDGVGDGEEVAKVITKSSQASVVDSGGFVGEVAPG